MSWPIGKLPLLSYFPVGGYTPLFWEEGVESESTFPSITLCQSPAFLACGQVPGNTSKKFCRTLQVILCQSLYSESAELPPENELVRPQPGAVLPQNSGLSGSEGARCFSSTDDGHRTRRGFTLCSLFSQPAMAHNVELFVQPRLESARNPLSKTTLRLSYSHRGFWRTSSSHAYENKEFHNRVRGYTPCTVRTARQLCPRTGRGQMPIGQTRSGKVMNMRHNCRQTTRQHRRNEPPTPNTL